MKLGEWDGLVVVPVDDDLAELLCGQRDCLMYAEPVGSGHQHKQAETLL
jgi:hypothetical protein